MTNPLLPKAVHVPGCELIHSKDVTQSERTCRYIVLDHYTSPRNQANQYVLDLLLSLHLENILLSADRSDTQHHSQPGWRKH